MVEYTLDQIMTPIVVYRVDRNKLLVRGVEGQGWIYKKNALKMKDAVKHYKKHVEENSRSAEAWLNLAHARASAQRDFKQALKDCSQALKLNDRLARGYKIRGNLLLALGDTDAALENYQKAVDVDPKYAPCYNNLGAMYMKQGKFKKAIRYFEQALKLTEKGIYYRNIGTVYINQGDFEKAKEFLLKAIKKNAQNAETQYALGYVYFVKPDSTDEDMVASIKHFKSACELTFWKNKGYLVALSTAYERNGQDDEAGEIKDKIDELDGR